MPGKQVAISPRSLFPPRGFLSKSTNGSLFMNSSSISNLSHQHLKISYHHMASLRKNLEEKYDEVYAPSNGISPVNSGEKFDEEPYRSFSLSEISVHESACIFQRSPTKLSTQRVSVLSRLSPEIRKCLLLGLVQSASVLGFKQDSASILGFKQDTNPFLSKIT